MFRRREGHLLAALLGSSLRHRLVLRLYPFTRRSSFRGSSPVCGPSSGVAHSSFFTAYLFLAALSFSRWVPVPGQTDVFPVCGRPRLLQSFSVCYLFCGPVPRCLGVQGRSDVFPDRVQVHGLFHFCVFLPLHCLRGCELRVAPPCFIF